MSIFDALKDALNGRDDRERNDVLPASQDPYGDPADQQLPNGAGYNNYGHDNVLPASEDPLGDPADQEDGFGNVLPASQDPYGDPADQEQSNNGSILGGIFRRTR